MTISARHTELRSAADRAIQDYDRLLETSDTRQMAKLLTARKTGVYYQGRPVCGVLRPCFIDESAYRRAMGAARKIAQALNIVAGKLAANDALVARLRLPPAFFNAVEFKPDVTDSAYIARLDGFVGIDGQIRFVEYNVDPWGVDGGHALAELFSSMPIMKAIRRRFHVRTVPLLEEKRRALRTLSKARGGTRTPLVVVFADKQDRNADLLELTAFMPGSFEFVGDPTNLTYRRNRVFLGERVVDFIMAFDPLRFARSFPHHPLVNAIRKGGVGIFNGIAGRAFRASRTSFELMTDERNRSWFPKDIQGAISQHVPWTRRVVDAKTSFNGEEVELVPFIRGNKDRLVLKQCPSFGGQGTVLGWQVDSATWSQWLRKALRKNFVVQERVHIPHRAYPVLKHGRILRSDFYTDLNPFVWNRDRTVGALVRLSSRALLNITSGGWAVPVFIVSDKRPT